MALILREADVDKLATMPLVIDALDAAFREQSSGKATNEPRRRVRTPEGGTLHMLGAALPARGVYGFKAYTSSRTGARFMVTLYDSNDGRLLALIEADRLGQLRTGAASGVATRYMAPSEEGGRGLVVACYGSGYQARTQVEAVAAVRKIERLHVYSRDAEKREAFARELGEAFGFAAVAVVEPEEAVNDANLIITATSSREPVLRGEWLKPGVHINAVGSNMLARRELTDSVVSRADRIAVDSIEQAKLEATDLLSPWERGFLYWERLVELRQIVAGVVNGRSDNKEITLFKSLGIGLEDVAAGELVYRLAREQGVGEEISFLS